MKRRMYHNAEPARFGEFCSIVLQYGIWTDTSEMNNMLEEAKSIYWVDEGAGWMNKPARRLLCDMQEGTHFLVLSLPGNQVAKVIRMLEDMKAQAIILYEEKRITGEAKEPLLPVKSARIFVAFDEKNSFFHPVRVKSRVTNKSFVLWSTQNEEGEYIPLTYCLMDTKEKMEIEKKKKKAWEKKRKKEERKRAKKARKKMPTTGKGKAAA